MFLCIIQAIALRICYSCFKYSFVSKWFTGMSYFNVLLMCSMYMYVQLLSVSKNDEY